jgi:hypothetical protein
VGFSPPLSKCEKSKVFFFEKKKQKTFGLWRARSSRRGPQGQSFLVLFYKKELLSFLP